MGKEIHMWENIQFYTQVALVIVFGLAVVAYAGLALLKDVFHG